MEASAHSFPNLGSPSSLSTVGEGVEAQHHSDPDDNHVVAMYIRRRGTKAEPDQQEDCFFSTTPDEETDDDESRHSFDTCFSQCPDGKELPVNCFPHKEEDERPHLCSFDCRKLVRSHILRTSASCHVSSCLGSPSSSISVDEKGEAQRVVTMNTRKQKGSSFPPSPSEETDGDESQVFDSVKSCFSRCPSEEESLLDRYKKFRSGQVWKQFCQCEGWPFGLYRRALTLPPSLSSPSDSWTWSRRCTHGCLFDSRTAIMRR